MSVYTVTDAALLDALRAQLRTISGVTVPDRIGDRPDAKAGRHKLIEIEPQGMIDTGTPYARGNAIDAERTYVLRWWHRTRLSTGEVSDNTALTFRSSIAAAVAGVHTWGRLYRMVLDSVGGLDREDGYYTGEIEITSLIPAPTGVP